MARKYRAAEADNARIAEDFAHTLRRQGFVIDRRTFDPFVTAIGLDNDRKCWQTGRVRRNALFNGQHGAGCRGMNRRGNPFVRIADALPLEYPVTRLNEWVRHAAYALVQWHNQQRGQRSHTNRRLHRGGLVGIGLDAALEFEQWEHQATRFISTTGYFHFQLSMVSSMTFMLMHSTGQGLRHNSQPVHSDPTMVCICLAAPTMASTGQA